MSDKKTPANGDRSFGENTEIIHHGRDPFEQFGFINPPVYRGSTVLFPTVEALNSRNQPYLYGRRGTPTVVALQDAIANLEGGQACKLVPSGMAAVTAALVGLTKAGDHILISDSVYNPTRGACDGLLARFGVEVTYYDPLIGADIKTLLKPNTTVVYCEAPGSQTFEMQDIPAIADVAKAHGAWVVMDNTWASPLYFKPFTHGVDVSIQAATKYIGGHADAMLGSVTSTTAAAPYIEAACNHLGHCAGSEETFLGLRGIRTISVRLKHHWQAGLEVAEWLRARDEVAEVLHPALPGCDGHELWKRDFLGASGLFSIVLKPMSASALAAMLDDLELFGMGYSWGGFESLIVPFDPTKYRTATSWNREGPALRLHIGLEDVDDLKADLAAGFERAKAAS